MSTRLFRELHNLWEKKRLELSVEFFALLPEYAPLQYLEELPSAPVGVEG
jgi:hypothetical protein